MAKVIRKLTIEDDMDFGSIAAFKTESYTGFWDYTSEQYLFISDDEEKWVTVIPECEDLTELDEKVFELLNERILEVFGMYDYRIKLEVVKND